MCEKSRLTREERAGYMTALRRAIEAVEAMIETDAGFYDNDAYKFAADVVDRLREMMTEVAPPQ